jgi:hypothetical protein
MHMPNGRSAPMLSHIGSGTLVLVHLHTLVLTVAIPCHGDAPF